MDKKIIRHIDTHQPHDSFFRKSMEDVKVAKAFLEAHMPKNILKKIDLNYLELQPNTHTTGIGEKMISDVIYKTKIDHEDAYLYFALEHQSSNDPIIAFRVLRYIPVAFDI